jgi:hypothetical protein
MSPLQALCSALRLLTLGWLKLDSARIFVGGKVNSWWLLKIEFAFILFSILC